MNITVPRHIDRALRMGAALALSISGGKDSQEALRKVVEEKRQRSWPGPMFAIHADMGRPEWPQTLPHCQRLCDRYDVELVVVELAGGDLLDLMRRRMETLRGTGKPFWPSAAARYCTRAKIDAIDKYLRRYDLVVSMDGIRREESDARAAKTPSEIRSITGVAYERCRHTWTALAHKAINKVTGDRDGRLAFTWRPILDWTKAQVYEAAGHSLAELARRRNLYQEGREAEALAGWQLHPAYVFGNDRLSCALCVIGSLNDLRVGARHNPGLLLDEYIPLEVESGSTFKSGWSLQSLLQAELPL